MPIQLTGRRLTCVVSALTLTVGTGLAVPMALAAPAGAATSMATVFVNDNQSEVFYTAAAGQANKVTITETATAGLAQLVYAIDDDVPITAGLGCTYPVPGNLTKISCTVTAYETEDPYAALKMDLGDGDDSVVLHNDSDQEYYFDQIYLGTGNDSLTTTGLDGSYYWGQAGDDTITVGDAAFVYAGDDDDTVHANGADGIVDGGKGSDVLYGGAGGQALTGGDGNDAIYGGTDADRLYGGKGDDVLYGNSGNDRLYGGPGNDTLSGGPGTDVVHQN